jgi:hypothetical protein
VNGLEIHRTAVEQLTGHTAHSWVATATHPVLARIRHAVPDPLQSVSTHDFRAPLLHQVTAWLMYLLC